MPTREEILKSIGGMDREKTVAKKEFLCEMIFFDHNRFYLKEVK